MESVPGNSALRAAENAALQAHTAADIAAWSVNKEALYDSSLTSSDTLNSIMTPTEDMNASGGLSFLTSVQPDYYAVSPFMQHSMDSFHGPNDMLLQSAADFKDDDSTLPSNTGLMTDASMETYGSSGNDLERYSPLMDPFPDTEGWSNLYC